MKEIIRNGLRFPVENDEYVIPPELGEELKQLNREMIDGIYYTFDDDEVRFLTIMPAKPLDA